MLRFITRKLFGIKSIGSIQIAATAEAQRSVDEQVAVALRQAKIIKRATRKQEHADEEAKKGNTFIKNFNKMFEETSDEQ